MRIVFAGTPEISAIQLRALQETSHTIVGVYTQPDRPSGRGQAVTASPVKQVALDSQIPVFQPTTLKTPEALHTFTELAPDIVIVVAYGLIVPPAILALPRWGCINLHVSLLPRWRGAAPIQHALLAGDTLTGLTWMKMNAGLDTGDILEQIPVPILPTDTTGTLHDRLAEIGATHWEGFLARLPKLTGTPQIAEQATYASKISKEMGRIDWHKSAVVIERQIRAFLPRPVAFTQYQDQVWRIWRTVVLEGHAATQAPGTVLAISPAGIDVCTGEGILRLEQLQLPGRKVLTVRELSNGQMLKVRPGEVLLGIS